MYITKCYCCGEPCEDWGTQSAMCCRRCAIEVHSLESGEDASYRYGNLNPVFGNGFPILPQEKSGRWDVHVAAVKAKYCNNKQSTVTSSTKNANDYLCKCGRKCNKTETKCWWCGAPIQ